MLIYTRALLASFPAVSSEWVKQLMNKGGLSQGQLPAVSVFLEGSSFWVVLQKQVMLIEEEAISQLSEGVGLVRYLQGMLLS